MEDALAELIASICPVYWYGAPQPVRPPVIVLTKISGGLDYTLDGVTQRRPVRVQADVYGADNAEMRVLTGRLIHRVSGRQTRRFAAIFVESERDFPGPDAGGNRTEFRTSVDLMIHWRG
jgi:hypothetical protein